MAKGNLSQMPPAEGLVAQTNHSGSVEIFCIILYASRPPYLNTTHRVLSRGLELAQIVERRYQRLTGSYHYGGVVLLYCQRTDSLCDPQSRAQLFGDVGIAPLSHQRGIQKYRAVERMT